MIILDGRQTSLPMAIDWSLELHTMMIMGMVQVRLESMNLRLYCLKQ